MPLRPAELRGYLGEILENPALDVVIGAATRCPGADPACGADDDREHEQVDLVDETGAERVARQVRAAHAEVPVVCLFQAGDGLRIELALEAGAWGPDFVESAG